MSSSSLGRGLGALIPQSSSEVKLPAAYPATPELATRKVAIGSIAANPWQPRTQFDKASLQELADSIKHYGIIQPLVITPAGPGRYQLIAGERRLQAARLVGLTEVPVIIRQAEEQEKLELALVENIQRQNLNPLDEAVSYQRLMTEFNLTQEDVAARVGKSRSSVANFLRLLNLPEEIKQALRQEKITFSHAKVILSETTREAQLKLLAKILAQDLPVSQAAQKTTKVAAHQRVQKDPVIRSLEDKLTKQLGAKTVIKMQPQGGVIEVTWLSEEDLKRLSDQLLGH
ncbi:MAG: ParB/RepB/Spo0J family partition protein [Candidatus Komeilibacteria bacterium]